MSLWLEQRGICWICLQPMRRDVASNHALAPTVDHLRPRSKGGKDGKYNLLLAHKVCNTERGNELPGSPIQEFRERMLVRIRTCKSYPKHPIEDLTDEETNRANAYKHVRYFLAGTITSKKVRRNERVRRDVIVKSSYKSGEAERAMRNVFGPQQGMGRPGDL